MTRAVQASPGRQAGNSFFGLAPTAPPHICISNSLHNTRSIPGTLKCSVKVRRSASRSVERGRGGRGVPQLPKPAQVLGLVPASGIAGPLGVGAPRKRQTRDSRLAPFEVTPQKLTSPAACCVQTICLSQRIAASGQGHPQVRYKTKTNSLK